MERVIIRRIQSHEERTDTERTVNEYLNDGYRVKSTTFGGNQFDKESHEIVIFVLEKDNVQSNNVN